MARFRGLTAVARVLRDVRVVVWFVLVLAGLFVADKASAQNGSSNGPYASISAAYNACAAEMANNHWGQGAGGLVSEWCKNAASTQFAANFPNTILGCINRSTDCAYYEKYPYTTGCTAPATWNETTHSCYTPVDPADVACADEPGYYTTLQFPNGAIFCDAVSDCKSFATNLGDGGEVAIAPVIAGSLGDSCDHTNFTCPTGYVEVVEYWGILQPYCVAIDGDEDSDGLENGDDPAPVDFGSGQDTDGDGVPDSRDPFPLDPDNGQELENGETTATSSGGGNCQSPPITNGDAVGAQVAYQTWATRCAVERLNATTKGGVSVTVVGGSTSSGNSTQAEIEGLSDGEGMAASGDAAGLTQNLEFGAGGLDDTRFGAQVGGTCPVIPPINLGAMGTLEIDTTRFCEWMELTSILVLILASLGSLRILGGPA